MITIVSGVPRSGTSLMMRMLEAGGLPVLTDDHRPADLDNPRGYYEYEPVKFTGQDASWVDLAEGRAVKVIYKLLEALPADRDYQVLFMQRHLKEVVASQNRMLERLAQASSGRHAGAAPPGGRQVEASAGRGPGNTGSHIMVDEHRLVGMLASQVAQCRAWLAGQPRFRVLYVNYNQLIATPDVWVHDIVQFCGGRLDAAGMRSVIDPNLYRRRLS